MTNPRDITKKLLRGEDCSDCVASAYEVDRWQVEGCSYATSDGVNVVPGIVYNIASITKTFTAATVLRMIEDERFSGFFKDGINTKLSDLVLVLQERYPESEYIQTKLTDENNFSEITLANLLNHSAGIGDFDGEDFGRKLAFESAESPAREPDGKFFTLARKEPRPEFGKYSYSNLGYELLGMIIAAVGSKAIAKKVTCGEMMRELVIDKIGLKETFTCGEMIFDGEVKVAKHPEIMVAQAFDSNRGARHTSLVFRRAIATSGIYASPSDLCKFANNFFSGELFEKTETSAMRDAIAIETKPGEFYAAGYESYSEADGTIVKFHSGKTQGFFGWLGYRNDKAACCLVNCNNKEIAAGVDVSDAAASAVAVSAEVKKL